MFKVNSNYFRLLLTIIMIFGCLLIVSACSGDKSATTTDTGGQDNNENSSSEAPSDKDEFINKSIYSLPDYEDMLKKYKSFAFTFNGHENRIDFLGEEEVDGVMTERFYLKIADDHGEVEYEIWMNDEGLAEKAIALDLKGHEFSTDSAYTWIGNTFKPLYEFNREFRYPIDSNDFTIDSHETHNDKLLDYDVVVHTLKGIDKYSASGDTEYEVVVADAGEFEFILDYVFHDNNNEQKTFELTEMELR